MLRSAVWLGSTTILASAAFSILNKAGLIAMDPAGQLANFTALIGIIAFLGTWYIAGKR